MKCYDFKAEPKLWKLTSVDRDTGASYPLKFVVPFPFWGPDANPKIAGNLAEILLLDIDPTGTLLGIVGDQFADVVRKWPSAGLTITSDEIDEVISRFLPTDTRCDFGSE